MKWKVGEPEGQDQPLGRHRESCRASHGDSQADDCPEREQSPARKPDASRSHETRDADQHPGAQKGEARGQRGMEFDRHANGERLGRERERVGCVGTCLQLSFDYHRMQDACASRSIVKLEERTARLTILVDPRKKAVFERLCAQEDLTPSQVLRRLIRGYIEQRLGRPWQPGEESAAPEPQRVRGPVSKRRGR